MYTTSSFATLATFPHHKWPPASLRRPPSNRSGFIARLAHNKQVAAAESSVLVHDHHEQMNNIVPSTNTSTSTKMHQGLGIESFLSGKTWLITGATGFLGKVLVEKILRSIPDTEKIYVMIKAADGDAAMRRLKTEIIEADIFRVLKELHEDSYERFMMSKLVPIVGDLTHGPGLGIDDPQVVDSVTGGIDIMVNSAANTTFDERYDVAINTNTKGAIHLMEFAGKCTNLKLFLQVSTIYANGGRKGRVMEKAFNNGDTTLATNNDTVLDVAAEIEFALNHLSRSSDHRYNNETSDDLQSLGLQRARKFGWHDTYTFTKAMGEMMIGECMPESKVPVVVVRPSIIQSTYADPFPGWIEGNRTLDPIAQNYCKGRMTSFPGDPNSIMDVVPVDMVVNAILAAVTRHGSNPLVTVDHDPTVVNVYQIGSSTSNPMTLSELFMSYYHHFRSNPVLVNGDPVHVPGPLDICTSIQEFSSGLRPAGRGISGRKMRQLAVRMATLYMPYTSFMGRYDCSNTERLMSEMSEEEMVEFGFDVTQIDWKRYVDEVHIPGLRKHVMKERVQDKVYV